MSEWDPFDDRPRRRRRKTVTRKRRRRTDPFGYEEERPRRRRSTTAKKTTKKRKRGILRDIADTARGVKILAKTVTARPRRKIKRVAKRAVGIFAYDPDNLKRRSHNGYGSRYSLSNVKHNIRRIKHKREDDKLHSSLMRKKAKKEREQARKLRKYARYHERVQLKRDLSRVGNSIKSLFTRKKRNQNTPPPDPFD